jgi:hypothetical protein
VGLPGLLSSNQSAAMPQRKLSWYEKQPELCTNERASRVVLAQAPLGSTNGIGESLSCLTHPFVSKQACYRVRCVPDNTSNHNYKARRHVYTSQLRWSKAASLIQPWPNPSAQCLWNAQCARAYNNVSLPSLHSLHNPSITLFIFIPLLFLVNLSCRSETLHHSFIHRRSTLNS